MMSALETRNTVISACVYSALNIIVSKIISIINRRHKMMFSFTSETIEHNKKYHLFKVKPKKKKKQMKNNKNRSRIETDST